MNKFNYILNDVAFDTLVIKCLYAEPTDEDIEECENQIKLLQQENKQLKEELKYTVPIVEHNKIVSKKLKEIRQLKEEKEELKKYLEEDDWSSVNGEIASKLILDKIKELEEGVK